MNEKELARFIIWEYVDTFKEIGYSNVQNNWLRVYPFVTQKYERYKSAMDLLDTLFNCFQSKLYRERGKKILFRNIRYPAIILGMKKHYLARLIVEGKVDRLFALKNFIGYTSISGVYQFVYNYLTERNEDYLYELINKVEEKLDAEGPNYIVLSNDCLPIERAIVLASKRLGITTIAIQHGMLLSTFPIEDGKVADYVLVWGRYFYDLYVKKGIRKPEEVYILGYPYQIEKNVLGCGVEEGCVVCYLGQDSEKYNRNLLGIKIDTVRRLNETCTKLGMKFIYRPHPGDEVKMLKSKLPGVEFTQKGEKLVETFRKGDVFISFDTASLIEAAIHSKICLQLMNYPVQTDNFEELGVCDKSFKEIEELEEYLKTIVNLQDLGGIKTTFNNDYIDISHNPVTRFLEILDNIEKNKRDKSKSDIT